MPQKIMVMTMLNPMEISVVSIAEVWQYLVKHANREQIAETVDMMNPHSLSKYIEPFQS